jgi:hypothetical protein
MTDLNAEILNWIAFAKGDVVGHEFHGNQYTDGASGIAARTDSLVRNQAGMSRAERAREHETIASQHNTLADQHRREAEALKAPVATPKLDKAIERLRAVRDGRVFNGSASKITTLGGLTTALNGALGDPTRALAVSIEALASATPGSPLEAQALASASGARDETITSLLGTAQHIEDVVDGNDPYELSPHSGEIAPQDREALRETATRLTAQARDIMESTSGLGLDLPRSIEYDDPNFGISLSGTLTTKDGENASTLLLDMPDFPSGRTDASSVYNFAHYNFSEGESGKDLFATEFYNKLSPESQKMLEDASIDSIQSQQDWTTLPAIDLPAGATVPILTVPQIAATGSVSTAGGNDPAEMSASDHETLFTEIARLNAGQLQPSTIKTLREIASNPPPRRR